MSVPKPQEDPDALPRLSARGPFLAAIGLVGAGIAGVFLMRRFDLGWWGAGAYTLFLAILTALLMRSASRRAAALGCASPAMMRYNRRMLLFSMLYMAGLFGAVLAYKRFHVEGVALWVAGFAPSVGTIGMVWSMARLLSEETDEYLRFRMAREALFATGIVLVVTTVWGFLEQLMLVPHVPSWAVLPLFAIALGLGNVLPRGAGMR